MLAEYKDFRAEEDRVREELEPLLSVRDCRRILGVSVRGVLSLVKAGKLEAFGLDGPIDRDDVDDDTFGVRITPSSVKRYLEEIRIK